MIGGLKYLRDSRGLPDATDVALETGLRHFSWPVNWQGHYGLRGAAQRRLHLQQLSTSWAAVDPEDQVALEAAIERGLMQV